MPVFSIQVPSGQTLDIQADTPQAAMTGAQQWHAQQQQQKGGLQFDVNGARQAGYSDAEIVSHLADTKSSFDVNGALKAGYSPTEILTHLAPEQSGIVDNLRQGASEALSGVGSTIKNYAGSGYGGDTLEAAGKSIAPANFVPSPLVDKDGFHPSNVLRALARATPGAATAIGAGTLAALAAPEAAVMAPIAGATAAGVAMTAGPEAQLAATNRTGDPNAAPNTADLTRGGLTSLGSSAVQALPVGRYLSRADVLAKTGAAGVIGTLKKLGVTSAAQGAASGGSNVAEQTGQSLGTPGGLKVDPTQVADSAAGGALTGAVIGGMSAPRESLNATTYRAITPDLQPAATQFANRIQQAAGGASLNAGVIGGGGALRAGAVAFTKASAAVKSELGDAVSDLRNRVTLPTDANNVLDAAMSGLQPNARDYATLSQALQGDPQAGNVMNLVRQAHVADIVQNTGTLTDKKFVGGLSGIPTALSVHSAGKSALAALAGAGLEGGAGHIIAYTPEVITALAGLSAAARVTDRLTGARAPAGRFVSNFADGTTPVRLPQPLPPQSVATSAPVVRPRPTGPAIAPPAAPWANGPQAQPAPAAAPQFAPRPPVAGGTMLTPQIQAVMAAHANLQRLAGANAPAAVPASAAPIDPLALPRNITGPAATLMRGAAMAAKLKADALGQSAATSEVNASPFIQQKVGNAANVPTPAATKYMSSAVRGANVLAKLQSDPEAAAANKAAAKAQLNTAMAAAKAATIPAKPAVNEPLQITGVTKSGGSVGVKTSEDEYVVPRSPYANLVPSAAAQQFLADAQNGGTAVTYKQGFVNATVRKITDIRNRAAAVAKEVQGVNPNATAAQFANEIAAQFEGVSTQKDAINHREWLKRHLPQAAAALDQHFSDEAIKGTPNKAGMWKRVGR